LKRRVRRLRKERRVLRLQQKRKSNHLCDIIESMKNALRFFVLVVIFLIPQYSHAQESTIEREARLRAELAQVEAEQRETEKILAEAQGQSASLKRDILILDTKIKAAELNIRAKNLVIQTLGKDITKKEQTIGQLQDRIERGKDSLAQILRRTNEVGTLSIPEIVLSGENMTSVLGDLDTFESVQSSLKTTFEEVRSTKAQTETEKETLDKRRSAEIDARAVIEKERKNIAANQAEKNRLLTVSKGNEKTYSAVLAEKKKKAAEIRAALFTLRDTKAIPFGEALKYANAASTATGIRPAFLLGIFAQESSFDRTDSTFGKQVGSCYVTDTKTGAGASVTSGRTFENVMHPTRDIPHFVKITEALGLDYTKTLVSCPQEIGYGGAMGPAQFIPSTWVLYVNRIKTALGISTPNPWQPEHAFMAAAMLLVDNGAKYGSYTSERNAACKYFSGRSCPSTGWVRSYGDGVMSKADMIQRTMIDPLQGI
jgi:peptidoglycan hydrolase CwlO-like protein